VVAKGYLDSSDGSVPITWSGEKTFTIVFQKHKHTEETEAVTVHLP
jgi:hypothetical protein